MTMPMLPPGMIGRPLPPGLANRGLSGPPGLQNHSRAALGLLATLMLNKRLRQGGMNQPPRMGQPPPMGRQLPNQNRMSDLARMQLEMGRSPSASRYY